MDEFSLEDKQKFAAAWHKDPQRPLIIAQNVLGLDLPTAMRCHLDLIRDPTVLSIKAELDKQVDIPTRNEFAAMVLRGACESFDNGQPKHDGKTRALMWKLAAEVLGYVGANAEDSMPKRPKIIPTDLPPQELQDAYTRLLK